MINIQLKNVKHWVLLLGATAVLFIALYETNSVKEGISGGVEAQLSAGSGSGGQDPYGLYGGSTGGRIVPANAAYSNIDAYPTSGQGYAPSAPSGGPAPQQQRGPRHTGTSTGEAYRRYQQHQRAQQVVRQRRGRWPWPLSLFLN